jgi:hypothetical protein
MPPTVAAMFARSLEVRVCLALLAATPAASLSVTSLAQRASALPWSCVGELDGFAFQSEFTKDGRPRGWANWLVEDRLMLGQYPHCQPSEPGPSAEDAHAHLRSVLAAGVDCFACLQAELPPQADPEAWPAGGVQLPEAEDRARWPARFVRYAAEADAIAAETGGTLLYLHCPIDDLSVPCLASIHAREHTCARACARACVRACRWAGGRAGGRALAPVAVCDRAAGDQWWPVVTCSLSHATHYLLGTHRHLTTIFRCRACPSCWRCSTSY